MDDGRWCPDAAACRLPSAVYRPFRARKPSMIIIVGAGPAGLATACYLQQRGLPYRVLERGTVGYAWQNHYDRLHLHTLKQVSALPGLPMPRSYPPFPSGAQVQRYLDLYARHFALRVEHGVTVQHARFDGCWQLATSQGPLCGDTLVVASGIWSTPVCPTLGGEARFGGPILHSSIYRNAAPFRGQRVLVVGAGNSGAEIAVDLSEHGVTASIAIRSGVTFVVKPRSATAMRSAAWLLRKLPRVLGERMLQAARRDYSAIIPQTPGSPLDAFPVVDYALPEAVKAGRVTVYSGVNHFVAGGARFDDGQTAPFDAVIMATGYRPSVDFLDGQLALDIHGQPLVNRHWQAINNLHLLCVGFWYPTTEGWLQAISRVAREAVDGLDACHAHS